MSLRFVYATSVCIHFFRLKQIRPGAAHDGQFFVEDQIWPGASRVLLPEVDHAQTVMGNAGFDSARLWGTLLEMLFARIA